VFGPKTTKKRGEKRGKKRKTRLYLFKSETGKKKRDFIFVTLRWCWETESRKGKEKKTSAKLRYLGKASPRANIEYVDSPGGGTEKRKGKGGGNTMPLHSARRPGGEKARGNRYR